VHRRRVILEVHNAREDEPRCLAVWMRTRDPSFGGEAFQVLPNLVHHLVGSGIFVDSVVVGQAFVSQAKRTLGGPADHREIFRTFVRVVHRTLRVLLLDSGLGPTAALGFPPIA